MSEAQASMTEEEQRRAEFFGRANGIGQGLVLTLNAAGTPIALAIEGLSAGTRLYLANLAKRDPQSAAIIANNLAHSLVQLCQELGIISDEAVNGAQAN